MSQSVMSGTSSGFQVESISTSGLTDGLTAGLTDGLTAGLTDRLTDAD